MANRRDFLKQTPALIGLLTSLPALAQAAGNNLAAKKSIILRSSWQTVNIGDIGHTPGVLALLEKYLPDVEVRLWPSSVDNGVDELLRRRFPKVPIIKTPEEIALAMKECVFLLHGSGPSLVARNDVKRWDKETGKPFGVYGITFPGVYSNDPKAAVTPNPVDVELLSKARFALFRDSVSLEFAKTNGVTSPVMEFCPDGAFGVDLRNDQAATTFMKEHGLEEGKFMCVIPRTRFTPYWEIPAKKTPFDEKRDARNKEMREHDNAPLREAIIAVVRQTPMKVLICPEDETQVKLGKEILLDKLPDDVKAKVVWRDHYWLTDEAVSTYIRSAGLFGLEMHSPIMCIGNGIPAIVGRFFEQTSKGFMWRDIGLGDWLFDMDNEKDIARYAPTVLAMAKDPKAAKAKAAKARKFVEQRQRETMGLVKKNVTAV
ncbi:MULTISPECIES: polysaccharide pyruvyl transferase family protein [unclassified Spirosoma]|uniref:polysaccharide pyruvyl transferase family protein n=1 Tax=unclassified Spirosoma TaxID=2621999 RepID=UPI00095BD85B|nr:MULTISPECIES: polysaccharide pyruvyl transferase family protein [unclassified Spirosoma]MBN8820907.1 polysaccharide pyruvyl transferase family protein [Spirosoma sp.]OJW75923.1 MAG: polysaccharide pyruvyl transferase [Spirosoma sp. 48-14]